MTDYRPGDPVVYTCGSILMAAVVNETSRIVEDGFVIETADGTLRAVPARKLAPLPAGTPALGHGALVHVRDDAKRHAGQSGIVAAPGFNTGVFGYWVYLRSGSHVWISANELAATAGAR